jgi:hypothetical protein
MSARDLEDFIRVIESAERLSTSRTDRTSVVKSPTSSLWSYPTDLYHGSARFDQKKITRNH